MKNRKNGGFIGVSAPDTIRPDNALGVISNDEILNARTKGFNSPEFISRYPEEPDYALVTGQPFGADAYDPYYKYVFGGDYAPLSNATITSDQTNKWNAYLETWTDDDSRSCGATMFHQSNYFWSNRFVGDMDHSLTVNDTAILRLGTGAFTVEFWYKRAHRNAVTRYFLSKGNTTGPTGWQIGINSSFQIFYSDVSTTTTANYALKNDVWYHVAIVREGTGAGQLKIYINGTIMGTGTSASNFTQTDPMYVGGARDNASGTRLAGWLTDLRVSNVAVYTANTVPPVRALTNTPETVYSILSTDTTLGLEGPLWQAQGHTVSITNTRIPRMTDVPIKYTDPARQASQFYDGVANYFYPSYPNLTTGDMTMETWVLLDSFGGNTTPIFVVGTGAAGRNYGIFLNHTGNGLSIMVPNPANNANVLITRQGDLGTGNIRGGLWTGTGQLSTGKWHHIAFTRNSLTNNVTVFLNGNIKSQTNIGTVNFQPAAVGNTYIATSFDPGHTNFRGWIAGAAVFDHLRYTANFTPTLLAPTLDSGTLFNLNFNNDAAPTVRYPVLGNVTPNIRVTGRTTGGSPRLDGFHTPGTTVALRANVSPNMYHPGRAEVNGLLTYKNLASYHVGDARYGVVYTTQKSTDTSLDLGTDPFTIEAWIYVERTGTGGNMGIAGKGSSASTTGYSFEYNTVTTNRLTFRHGATVITATTGSIVPYTWNHVVAQRTTTGTNDFHMFVNGRVANVSTVSTNLTAVTEPQYILHGRSAATINPFRGKVNNFRISKQARYPTSSTLGTKTFTPSLLPFTSDANTSILLYNTFWNDKSTVNYLDVGQYHYSMHQVQAVSMQQGVNVGTHKNWSVAFNDNANGLRIYSSTNNSDALDAVSSDFAFGTSDFTWEVFACRKWRFNAQNQNTSGYIWNCKRISTPDDDSLAIYVNPMGRICVDYGDGTRSNTIIMSRTNIGATSDKWYHIVLQRVNNNLALYVNGIKEAEKVFTTNILCRNTTPCVGTQGTTAVAGQQSNSWYGFLSNLRVHKGKAFYAIGGENPARFKVPLEPLNGYDPTCVLLTFNNPAIVDMAAGSRNKGAKLIYSDYPTGTGHSNYHVSPFSPFKDKPANWRYSYGETGEYNSYHNHQGVGIGVQNGTYGLETHWMGQGETPFTIEFWYWQVKTAIATAYYPHIFRSATDAGTWKGIMLVTNTTATQIADRYGAISLRTFTDTAANNILSGNQFSYSLTGAFVHVALVCDPEATANKYAIFVNGILRSWSGLGGQFTNDLGGYPLEFQESAQNIIITKRAKYSTYQPIISSNENINVPGLFEISDAPIEAFTAYQPICNNIQPQIGLSGQSTKQTRGSTIKYVPEIGKFGTGSTVLQQQDVQNAGGYWDTTTPPHAFQTPDRIYFGDSARSGSNTPKDLFMGENYGDFTVEGWFAWRGAANPNDKYIFEIANSFALRLMNGVYNIRWGNNDAYSYNITGVTHASTSTNIVFDHIVLQYRGGNFMIFINGILVYTFGSSRVVTTADPIAPATSYTRQDSFVDTTAYIVFGTDAENTGTKTFRGYMQDLRLTRLARYDVRSINGQSVMVHRGTTTPALPTKPLIAPINVT